MPKCLLKMSYKHGGRGRVQTLTELAEFFFCDVWTSQRNFGLMNSWIREKVPKMEHPINICMKHTLSCYDVKLFQLPLSPGLIG